MKNRCKECFPLDKQEKYNKAPEWLDIDGNCAHPEVTSVLELF